MPLVDCNGCKNFKADVVWGPYTEPPCGFCHLKIIYIWKIPRRCTMFQPSEVNKT